MTLEQLRDKYRQIGGGQSEQMQSVVDDARRSAALAQSALQRFPEFAEKYKEVSPAAGIASKKIFELKYNPAMGDPQMNQAVKTLEDQSYHLTDTNGIIPKEKIGARVAVRKTQSGISTIFHDHDKIPALQYAFDHFDELRGKIYPDVPGISRTKLPFDSKDPVLSYLTLESVTLPGSAPMTEQDLTKAAADEQRRATEAQARFDAIPKIQPPRSSVKLFNTSINSMTRSARKEAQFLWQTLITQEQQHLLMLSKRI